MRVLFCACFVLVLRFFWGRAKRESNTKTNTKPRNFIYLYLKKHYKNIHFFSESLRYTVKHGNDFQSIHRDFRTSRNMTLIMNWDFLFLFDHRYDRTYDRTYVSANRLFPRKCCGKFIIKQLYFTLSVPVI